ncbi:MAG: DJ-1/PfpI family protein [Clostridiales Family XIII bacterium]|jgi:4-methyl-5(b-hydroxyethyl)-thiazole monophosphate biosynthesis|nr:DJ-1/PfpI family protein [Clostridiales Family XIII bacterium]
MTRDTARRILYNVAKVALQAKITEGNIMVYIFLAEGFEEIEALTPYDLLKRAGVDVAFVSISGASAVKAAHGAVVQADLLFADANCAAADMLVLPGGRPGADHLAAHAGLDAALKQAFAEGRKVAAICASPGCVLASKGLLNGRKATGYTPTPEEIPGAEITPGTVVVDGNLITSRGPATAMPFGLALIESLKGPEARAQIAGDLLYEG